MITPTLVSPGFDLFSPGCDADLVWDSIAGSLTTLVSTWFEHPEIVEKLNAFRRVCSHSTVLTTNADLTFHTLGIICAYCE